MPETMPAFRLNAWQVAPRMTRVPVPVPAAGELLIRVTATGICHSDLHVMSAQPGVMRFEPPFTLGHEVAGTVARVAAGVTGFAPGDAVVVHGVWACGECRPCLSGRENYCARDRPAVGCGLGRDGGLAPFMVVPSQRYLVGAAGLAPHLAAPLTDAGLTSLHALNRSRSRLGVDAVVAVIGIGGLGHLAIQLLRALTTATVVAVDPRAAARDLGLRCGATEVHGDADQALDAVGRHSAGRGADLVLDFVGAQPTVGLAARLVAPDGDLTIVGGAGGEIKVGKHLGLPAGCRISMPFWGTRAELADVVALARRGLVVPEVEQFGFVDVSTAYERLRAATILGRAVVLPGTEPGLDDKTELSSVHVHRAR
jgi:propanol-preferring alcohol dehydrogenase